MRQCFRSTQTRHREELEMQQRKTMLSELGHKTALRENARMEAEQQDCTNQCNVLKATVADLEATVRDLRVKLASEEEALCVEKKKWVNIEIELRGAHRERDSLDRELRDSLESNDKLQELVQ